MKILRRHCRPLLISIACGLVLVRSQATWGRNRPGQTRIRKAMLIPLPLQSKNLQRCSLATGTWLPRSNQVRAETPKGHRRQSNRSGPGGRSVIENYYTDGDSGSRSALRILWRDDKVQGYRTLFCDHADPPGCSVYDGWGQWEGNDLVFSVQARPRRH
jgi:hypothetical protein